MADTKRKFKCVQEGQNVTWSHISNNFKNIFAVPKCCVRNTLLKFFTTQMFLLSKNTRGLQK